MPRVQVVNSVRPRPEQVKEAILQTFSDAAEALPGKDVFKLSQSLIIFDQFEVEQVRLKGDHGWAGVRISELSSVREGRANLRKRAEEQRWVLNRRDHDNWEVVLPPEAIYLPRDIAVRIFAHQLAVLTEGAPEPASGAKEGAELARLLNALLE